MIPSTMVAEVKRLLAVPGLSQRKVAVLTGVSRASVGAIASGRRPDYPERCSPRNDDEDLPLGPVERCPSCGGRVYMPCRLCRVRALKFSEKHSRHQQPVAASWGLEAGD